MQYIDWKLLPFERHYPRSKEIIDKPASYDEMVELAERLASRLPFVRVDFYEIQNRPYFGELTLYPGDGFEEFNPEEWDEILGSWIKLPGGIIDIENVRLLIRYPNRPLFYNQNGLNDYNFAALVANRDFYMYQKIYPITKILPWHFMI